MEEEQSSDIARSRNLKHTPVFQRYRSTSQPTICIHQNPRARCVGGNRDWDLILQERQEWQLKIAGNYKSAPKRTQDGVADPVSRGHERSPDDAENFQGSAASASLVGTTYILNSVNNSFSDLLLRERLPSSHSKLRLSCSTLDLSGVDDTGRNALDNDLDKENILTEKGNQVEEHAFTARDTCAKKPKKHGSGQSPSGDVSKDKRISSFSCGNVSKPCQLRSHLASNDTFSITTAAKRECITSWPGQNTGLCHTAECSDRKERMPLHMIPHQREQYPRRKSWEHEFQGSADAAALNHISNAHRFADTANGADTASDWWELCGSRGAPPLDFASADARQDVATKSGDPRGEHLSARLAGSQVTVCQNTGTRPSVSCRQLGLDVSLGGRNHEQSWPHTEETRCNKWKQYSRKEIGLSFLCRGTNSKAPERQQKKPSKRSPTHQDDCCNKLLPQRISDINNEHPKEQKDPARQQRKDINKEQCDHKEKQMKQRTDIDRQQSEPIEQTVRKRRTDISKKETEHKENPERKQITDLNKEQREQRKHEQGHTGIRGKMGQTQNKEQRKNKDDYKQARKDPVKIQAGFGDQTRRTQFKPAGDRSDQNLTLRDLDDHRENHSAHHKENHIFDHRENYSASHREDHSSDHREDQSSVHSEDHSANQREDHSANQREDHSANQREDHSADHREDHSSVHSEDHSANQIEDHSADRREDQSAGHSENDVARNRTGIREEEEENRTRSQTVSSEIDKGKTQTGKRQEDRTASRIMAGRQTIRPDQTAAWTSHRPSSGKGNLSKRRQLDLLHGMKTSVNAMFPYLQERCYFVPPVHFNVAKRTGQADGLYFAQETPESHSRADETHERLLEVLKEVLVHRPAFVLSGICFEDYLNKRVPANQAGQSGSRAVPVPLPRAADLSPQYWRGHMDMAIIDKHHGVIIVDLKAVGDTFQEMNVDESEKVKLVSKVLEKALALMIKNKAVLLHLVSDIPATIPVSMQLVLPNLSKTTLHNTLQSNDDLRKALERCMATKGPLTEVCLCAEDLPLKHQPPSDSDITRLTDWWNRRYPSGQQVLEDDVYETIIARFSGPFSTIKVWTAQLPRIEVRTLGQAVSHTADSFATLLLMPQQRDVLESQESRMYLAGPPGAGKTLVLALKGLQWAREGAHVCILTAKTGPSPVALVIWKQILKTLKQSHNSEKVDLTHVVTDTILSDRDILRRDGSSLVKRLKAAAHGRLICLIMDDLHGEVIPFIHMLCRQLPGCRFWSAGPWPSYCPSGFASKELSTSIRCPPAVQALLQMTEPTGKAGNDCLGMSGPTQYRYVTRSTELSQYPLPTSGLPVMLVSHAGHGMNVPILQCQLCAEALVECLNEFGVGKDLNAEDVFIVTADRDFHHQTFFTSKIVQALHAQGLPVDIIDDYPGNQERLAFPSSKITLTSYELVTGLERPLVVFLPAGTSSDNLAPITEQADCQDDASNSSTVTDYPPRCSQSEIKYNAARTMSSGTVRSTPLSASNYKNSARGSARNNTPHYQTGAGKNESVDDCPHAGQEVVTSDQNRTNDELCGEAMLDDRQDVKENCQNSEEDSRWKTQTNRPQVYKSKAQEIDRISGEVRSLRVSEEKNKELAHTDRTDAYQDKGEENGADMTNTAVDDSAEEDSLNDSQEVFLEHLAIVTKVNKHEVIHERKETRQQGDEHGGKKIVRERYDKGVFWEDPGYASVDKQRNFKQPDTQRSEVSGSHLDRQHTSVNLTALATVNSADSDCSDNEQFQARGLGDEYRPNQDSYISIENYSSGYDSDCEDDGCPSVCDYPSNLQERSYGSRTMRFFTHTERQANHLPSSQQTDANSCSESHAPLPAPCRVREDQAHLVEREKENGRPDLKQKHEDNTLDFTCCPHHLHSMPMACTSFLGNDADRSSRCTAAAANNEGRKKTRTGVQSQDSKLCTAMQRLNISNREILWFSASRALGHCIVFHF